MALDTVVDKASPSSFELVFPIVPGGATTDTLATNKELTLNIFSTIIPGATLDLEEHRWQGTKAQRASGTITYEPWNINFIVDAEFKNWQILWKWMQYINNNKDKMLENHSDYAVDAFLRVVDNFQSEVFKLQFIGVWINNLSEITLSHREGSQQLECNAALVYDRFEIRE